MLTTIFVPRIARRWLVATAALAGASLAAPALAVDDAAPMLRAVPSALLSIDHNRATIVDRIVAEWGDALVKANAGIGVEQLRATLQAMRADYLLAASVAGSLEGLRGVLASSLTGSVPTGGKVSAKTLGDATDDLVYTPVVPCRIVDTRAGAGGTVLAGQTRNWLAANPAGNFAAQGGSASNCGIPVKPAGVLVNITVFSNLAGPAFMVAWPFNQARPNAALVNWVGAGSQLANAVAVPLCVGGGCTSDFSIFSSQQTEMVLDVLGYFAAPVATAVDCIAVASASTPVAVSSDTLVALPACTTGYTRTGSQCAGAANIPSGYLVETNATGCLYRNLSSVATFNATATATCCRIPGR